MCSFPPRAQNVGAGTGAAPTAHTSRATCRARRAGSCALPRVPCQSGIPHGAFVAIRNSLRSVNQEFLMERLIQIPRNLRLHNPMNSNLGAFLPLKTRPITNHAVIVSHQTPSTAPSFSQSNASTCSTQGEPCANRLQVPECLFHILRETS